MLAARGPKTVPGLLKRAILDGRCVAFVGAGFSRPVVPGWEALLAKIAEELGWTAPKLSTTGAFSNEMLGQLLRDEATAQGRDWKQLVRKAMQNGSTHAGRADLDQRLAHLKSIPFKAILTTNFDSELRATTERDYWDVLRTPKPGGWQLTHLYRGRRGEREQTPVIKLHGDLDVSKADELVFSRGDYRRLIHAEARYTNFIRSVFAGYTILFLGVSFTDAYLNELRSEVITLLGATDTRHEPWGYAVYLGDDAAHVAPFFRKHESIELLHAETSTDFTAWLSALDDATSVTGRLTTLLEGKHVLWVDSTPGNNDEGVALLRSAKAKVTTLMHPNQLDESHHGADLLISQFGRGNGTLPRAVQTLHTIRAWGEAPPVIVFGAHAEPAQLADNRRLCLRHGAFEYATQWSELYRLIESLFGRAPGSR